MKKNDTGKISQKEMIKQAMESIKRKKEGKYQLVYKKSTRTIVAELRKIYSRGKEIR